MLVVQRALIRIIIRWGRIFSFSNDSERYSNLLQHLVWYLSLHQRYTAGKNLAKLECATVQLYKKIIKFNMVHISVYLRIQQ